VTDLAHKVASRFLAKEKEIPVENQETGRIVYVLPETLEKEPSLYKRIPENKAGDPRWRGKSKPPRRPKKPHRPEIPRDTPPAPVRPPIPPKRVKPPKPVKPVPPLKGPKVPEPSPARKWKKIKRFLSAESTEEHAQLVTRVLERTQTD
jgi:hypothetical protein